MSLSIRALALITVIHAKQMRVLITHERLGSMTVRVQIEGPFGPPVEARGDDLIEVLSEAIRLHEGE